MSLESIVTDYIIEKFAPDLAGEDLPNDMNLQETGIVTSIGLVQIIGWCGEKFQIPINQLRIDPQRLTTVKGIADFITEHGASNSTEEH